MKHGPTSAPLISHHRGNNKLHILYCISYHLQGKGLTLGCSFIQLLPIYSKILHDYKTIHWVFYAFRILYFEARYCGRIKCAYFLLTPEINKSVSNQTTSSIWYNTFYDTTGLFVPGWINKSEGNRSDVKVIIPILPHRFDSGVVFILAADLYENEPHLAESNSLFNRTCFNGLYWVYRGGISDVSMGRYMIL